MPSRSVSTVGPLPQGEEIANRCQVCADMSWGLASDGYYTILRRRTGGNDAPIR